MQKALLIIDAQNDYFEGGKFPLWNTIKTLENIERATINSLNVNIPIILIKHVADPSLGIAPFFIEGTNGVELRKEIIEKVPDPIVVTKAYADGFYKTNLESILSNYGVKEIVLTGMMTQNCVTHTAISKSAEKYKVSILTDATSSASEEIHLIGLAALTSRPEISLTTVTDYFKS
ncbi:MULTISPECIES: cysteine hydrolase family protein [Enterococcus]|uniref:cysteine hydrolase family protein n=1 Tax=Enterococcus TaxID=1350 RepID=UPI00033140A7|nr:isochorismatase family protein [Enterococcus faecalis]EGO2705028.1 isochorismatase family protein [Enterococcus faecalis]EGO8848251.1 isochorismatase family protein [Enterococcus faecalis]ELT9180263.1 isochorismatase family protein [Enterococcus faecalis]EOJ67583.1 hypothetical protein WMY_02723 [Enterococcus faecalis EnGen0337]OTP10505.1 hypothetical protein A5830_002807 [Enterococcus faecalis]